MTGSSDLGEAQLLSGAQDKGTRGSRERKWGDGWETSWRTKAGVPQQWGLLQEDAPGHGAWGTGRRQDARAAGGTGTGGRDGVQGAGLSGLSAAGHTGPGQEGGGRGAPALACAGWQGGPRRVEPWVFCTRGQVSKRRKPDLIREGGPDCDSRQAGLPSLPGACPRPPASHTLSQVLLLLCPTRAQGFRPLSPLQDYRGPS